MQIFNDIIMQMNETRFKAKLNKVFKTKGFSYFNITDRFSSGVPDTYLFGKGFGFWIEYKVDYNQPTKLQTRNLIKLSESGVPAFVVRRRKDEYFLYSVSGGEIREWYRCDNIHEFAERVIGLAILSLERTSAYYSDNIFSVQVYPEGIGLFKERDGGQQGEDHKGVKQAAEQK